MISIQLSDDELAKLLKPVRGEGGWQRLLRRLQTQTIGSTLTLGPNDITRVKRYREKYGSGGWQSRLGFLDKVFDAAA